MSFWDKLFGSKEPNSKKEERETSGGTENIRKVNIPSGNGNIRRMTFFFDSKYPPYSEPKVIQDLISYFKLQDKLDPSIHITTQYRHVPAVPQYYSTGIVPDELVPFIFAHAAIHWGLTDEKAVGQIRSYCFRVTDIWGVLLTSEI